MNRFYRLLERLEIPKKRAFLHIFATVISGGFWFIFAVAIEVFLKSERANTHVLADAYLKKTQADILAEIDVKQDVLDQMEEFKEKVISTFESAFEKPFEISNVTLWESREKITTVTSGTSVGKTRAGTVGFGWSSGIGLAATQGVTRGTFTSGTTEIMKNEFTKLDSGVLRIGKDFTAFIGDQFTRTAKYPEVLLINTSYVFSIGLNILNAERAWLVQFTGEYESNLASEILNAAYGFGMNGKVPDLTSYRTEFDQEITSLKAEIKQLVIDLEETRESKLP